MKNINGPLKKAMSERFIILRSKMGLTQEEFSKKLGILRFIISDIENQRQLPTIPVIISLINTFHISPFWLLKGEGEMFIKDKEPGLSQAEYFKRAFPNVPPDADLIQMIEGMEIPLMKNALILKSLELKDFYRSQIEEYKREKERDK